MFAKWLTAKGNAPGRGAFSFRPAAAAIALFCLALASVAAAACAARRALVTITPAYVAPDPPGAVLYTATNCIRALAVGPRGAIWAATSGGAVLWAGDKAAPRIWTTASGLKSNDIRAVMVAADGARVTVTSPFGEEEIATQNGAVMPVPAASDANRIVAKPGEANVVTATAQGKDGGVLTATASGLVWSPRRGAKPQNVALPAPSRASHVSALVAQKSGAFIAGLYGDGAYRLTLAPRHAPIWSRLSLPDTCRFVTALALSPSGELVVGTRRDGAFVASIDKSGVCAPLPGANALPSGDIYGLAAYHGGGANGAAHLFATTFDQGVLEIGERGLVRVHKEATQGRALAAFGDRLYVLRADHTVWAFDGAAWSSAWPKGTLRRADVYSVFVDKPRHRLLVGGWGGWAEWDGYEWRQHWGAPELQNESVTAIVSDAGGAVWLGTQRKGLVRCVDGDAYAAFHETQGLTDDWITALAVSPKGRLLAGTYTGGLLERDGDRFVSRFRADKWAVRALAFRGETALAATPVGVWEEPDGGAASGGGDWRNIAPAATGGAEAQALLATSGGAWVGSRSGLAFVPR